MPEAISLSYDALMEVVRATIVTTMFAFLVFLGHREKLRGHKGWDSILFGVFLLALGCIVDAIDNFPGMPLLTFFGSSESVSFLKIFIGYIGGFTFMFFGFLAWVPMIEELKETRANAKARERENVLFHALQASPGLIAISSVSDGVHLEVNKAWLNTMGYSRSEVVGKTAQQLNIWATPQERQRMIASFGMDGALNDFETQLRTRSGELRDFLISGAHITYDGEDRLLLIGHDITLRRKVQSELSKSERELRGILDNMDELYYRADTDGVITFAAGAAEELTGWTTSGLVGVNINDRYIDPKGRQKIMRALEKGNGVVRNYESLMLRKDGSRGWLSANIRYLKDNDGLVIGVEGTVRDVTAAVEARSVLEHMAMHDVLTGLANRRSLEAHLDEALARARRSHQKGAALFFDLDGFKQINDKFGHDAGDTALKITAKRLKSISRETDFIARMGGDEFCAIIENAHDGENVIKFAEKAIEALSPPIVIAGEKIYVRASVGISIFDGSETDNPVHQVITEADRAMYGAKSLGGNTYCMYENALNDLQDNKA